MGGLTLLHPWLLGGLAAACLPVVIHLIGRRRAPTIHFAAFDFLAAVNKRLARRERLRQILLLTLRTLALVAVVLAAARPLPSRPAAVAKTSRRVAIIVDTSASMSYDLDGRTLFARAREKARDLVSHLAPGDTVTLLASGPNTRALLQSPTSETAQARAALDRLEIGSGTADLGAAIDLAASQFGNSPSGLTLFVVSDLSQNSFAALRPSALDPPPEVRLIDAADRSAPTALDNVAIESVAVESAGGASSERRFRVVVRNFGSTPVTDRSLSLLLNGEVTHRGRLDLPARAAAEKVFTHEFAGPGSFDGEARLERASEGFAVDDRALFGVDVPPPVRVLAVDGDVRTTPHEDELFFAERALSAVPKGDAPIDLRIVSVEELGSVPSLEGFGAVILANVGTLTPELLNRLMSFVRAGGGLLFTVGDRVHFEQANEVYAALLPHPLRDLHLAADAAAGTPPLGISGVDWDHPVVAGLGTLFEESLRASRTSAYFNLDVGADRRARVLLRFENGAPALIEARRDAPGRVMLLTTSLDLDLSDLALRSAYPAILQRTVRYLANAAFGGARVSTREGGAVDLAPPTGSTAVALASPRGVRRVVDLAGSTRAHIAGLDEVGMWRAEVSRGDAWTREVRLDVAVNPSLEESDFAPIAPSQVAAALGEGGQKNVEVAIGAGADQDPFDVRGFCSVLLLVFCFLFVGESLLASRG